MTDPSPVTGVVVSVSAGATHGPHKPVRAEIEVVAGLGVRGDAHFGRTVQHRSRARAHPDMANLRQVHLIACELHDELRAAGFEVGPGVMGENLLTAHVELLSLPTGTRVAVGRSAVLELSGLRNPCRQLDAIAPGLMAATLDRAPDGALIRRAGVMATVLRGGLVRSGDRIGVQLPASGGAPLQPV